MFIDFKEFFSELLSIMGKISYDDKLQMQTLREQGFGAKTIPAKYPPPN